MNHLLDCLSDEQIEKFAINNFGGFWGYDLFCHAAKNNTPEPELYIPRKDSAENLSYYHFDKHGLINKTVNGKLLLKKSDEFIMTILGNDDDHKLSLEFIKFMFYNFGKDYLIEELAYRTNRYNEARITLCKCNEKIERYKSIQNKFNQNQEETPNSILFLYTQKKIKKFSELIKHTQIYLQHQNNCKKLLQELADQSSNNSEKQ